jgi:hypothetical protein
MFQIAWTLNDYEWERANSARQQHAPDSEYDAGRRPLYYLLNGDFDIRYGVGRLYGDGGVNISLLDFAHFADRILREDALSHKVSFDQLDDDRHIRFDFSKPSVRISADDSETTVDAPRDEVIEGLRQFLGELARAIEEHGPYLFDWRSLEPLAAYRNT